MRIDRDLGQRFHPLSADLLVTASGSPSAMHLVRQPRMGLGRIRVGCFCLCGSTGTWGCASIRSLPACSSPQASCFSGVSVDRQGPGAAPPPAACRPVRHYHLPNNAELLLAGQPRLAQLHALLVGKVASYSMRQRDGFFIHSHRFSFSRSP